MTVWPYFIETDAVNLAVPLAEIKTWLKVSGTTLDAEITSLIQGATKTAEHLMKRDLINKTYRTFRDCFSDAQLCQANYAALIPRYSEVSLNVIELRKSRLQSVTSIECLKSDVWTLVDSAVYYNTVESAYSSILLVDGQSWPPDLDNRAQAVRIDFVAGYGPDSDDIPGDLKTAIKMHVANAFANRGDCASGAFLPKSARATYSLNRIMELGA